MSIQDISLLFNRASTFTEAYAIYSNYSNLMVTYHLDYEGPLSDIFDTTESGLQTLIDFGLFQNLAIKLVTQPVFDDIEFKVHQTFFDQKTYFNSGHLHSQIIGYLQNVPLYASYVNVFADPFVGIGFTAPYHIAILLRNPLTLLLRSMITESLLGVGPESKTSYAEKYLSSFTTSVYPNRIYRILSQFFTSGYDYIGCVEDFITTVNHVDDYFFLRNLMYASDALSNVASTSFFMETNGISQAQRQAITYDLFAPIGSLLFDLGHHSVSTNASTVLSPQILDAVSSIESSLMTYHAPESIFTPTDTFTTQWFIEHVDPDALRFGFQYVSGDVYRYVRTMRNLTRLTELNQSMYVHLRNVDNFSDFINWVNGQTVSLPYTLFCDFSELVISLLPSQIPSLELRPFRMSNSDEKSTDVVYLGDDSKRSFGSYQSIQTYRSFFTR